MAIWLTHNFNHSQSAYVLLSDLTISNYNSSLMLPHLDSTQVILQFE